ncbi:MAG: TrgA family protein [Pseudomonadota bacterium]
MPTIGKVAAAIAFAAAAYYVSTLIQPIYENERPLPNLPYWNAFFGLIVGWRVAGKRAGTGVNAMIGYAITTTIALVFTCLFFNCAAEMIRLSTRGQYDGPAEGIIAIVELMLEFGSEVATVEVIVATTVCGFAAAIVTEFFGRRFT